MPGCLEHTGVVTQLIREARENKGNLSVLWLDLENAFGSIPHKLVQFTLTKHHVPSRCRDLIADYYSNFRMRVSSGEIASSWHKVEIGIITGCTISVTLFSLAMNMLTKSAEPECRGPRTNSGQRQPPIRAFMDDLTVMTESVPGCRWILKGLEELVEWARMCFKPAKSRSMVLRKGKVVDKFRFNIADTAIPSISEKPVKSLGKVFYCSLRDTTSIQSTCTELDGWLKSVDKSGLPGKFKAWVYQHGILPRILWPLLVYAVPISTVETLERRGSLFWCPAQGSLFWSPAQGSLFWSPAQGSLFWSPAQGSLFWSPAQGSLCWSPAQGSLFWSPSQCSLFWSPAQGSLFWSPAQGSCGEMIRGVEFLPPSCEPGWRNG
ncbi:hypothetical protein NHX12_000397 [Muraenolepis orangiensis]|uniref:Reverse transcriptase domain-containing protein n=1 Tax=Muraenolepis orangiensis TaxID=630683 RepID=A0A9Q0D6B7_9TELE|nr:hypothetical protein NHX12_000397 [Muraenolepis orangiensis]